MEIETSRGKNVDLNTLTGDDLLDEMNDRAFQVLAHCAELLDQAYPDFKKHIQVKLIDMKARIEDQIIECGIEENLKGEKIGA